MTEITTKDGFIYLVSPYDEDIARKCRNLNGDWTGNAWKFKYDEDVLAAVKHAVNETFEFDYDAPRATAKIEFKEDFYQGKAPYTIGGYILSEARGRDSGAKVGPGVLLLEGKIESGGSMKNWSSEVRAGSVFKIKNFPKGAKVEDAENIIITYEDEDSTGADQRIALADLLDQYSVEDIEEYLKGRSKN
jgi:hypothetical protein